MIINPFPGLRPFRLEETHVFFGREGQIDEIIEKLEENRFVLFWEVQGVENLLSCTVE